MLSSPRNDSCSHRCVGADLGTEGEEYPPARGALYVIRKDLGETGLTVMLSKAKHDGSIIT